MNARVDVMFPAIRQRGVLVVDDSAGQRLNAVTLLRECGVSKIFEATDGEAGLATLRGLFLPPAIVVLDLDMPGTDGIQMLQQMAQEGLRPGLLVVSDTAQTILNTVETIIEALGLPLLAAVRKPLTAAHLEHAIDRFRDISRPPSDVLMECPPSVTLENLIVALDEKRIVPVYQPKVCLESGTVTGFEALARWREADDSLIPPSCFIGMAEQHNLIGCLTLTMLDQVLADMVAWQSQGFYPKLALNVSAQSLSQSEFATDVIRRVDAARISPSSLVIEITESALVTDLAATLGTLSRLRLKGFGLSIDDYGTGFSSMQQLSRLPFTELKIDRSFVHQAHTRWNLRAILQSTIEMGQRLGLATVAEGVETAEELALLESLGCQYAQGYLIAAPMRGSEVDRWMADKSPRVRLLCRV